MFNWFNKKKPKVYYARPIDFYGTAREARDLRLLSNLGFEVIEIRTHEIQQAVKERGMEVFKPLVQSADLFIFRPFSDKTVGAGVAKERAWAMAVGIPILEWNPDVSDRVLTVKETRKRLKQNNVYWS